MFLTLFGGIWAVVGGSVTVAFILTGQFGAQALIPLPFAVIGTALLSMGVVIGSRRAALYRNGTAVQAEVLAYEPTNMRVNRRRVHKVTFRFACPAGSITGSCSTVERFAPGSTAWVLYDPASPENAVIA